MVVVLQEVRLVYLLAQVVKELERLEQVKVFLRSRELVVLAQVLEEQFLILVKSAQEQD